MKDNTKKYLQKLLFVGAIMLFGACGVTQQIIKSGDPELIYEHALEKYEAEEWSKAIQLFDMSQPYYAGTSREDSLLFFKARCRFKDSDFDTAISELDEFRRTYGRSPFLEDAEGMYTLSHYYLSPSPERDQTMTHTAIRAIDEFISRYPNSEQKAQFLEIRQELQSRLYIKTYLDAYTYYKVGKYKSAIVAFENAMREYPLSNIREKVSFHIVASAFHLADNSIHTKKEDRYLDMMDNYYTFIAEFPESEFKNEVERMREKAERYLEAERKKRERKGDKALILDQIEDNDHKANWLEKFFKIEK